MPAYCKSHPDLEAENTCVVCTALLCAACSSNFAAGGTACPACIGADADRRRRTRLIGIGVGLVLVVGLVGFLLATRGGSEPAPEKKAGVESDGYDYGVKTKALANLVAILEQEPCNKKVAVDAGEIMNQAGNHRGALQLVAEFEAKCPTERRVWWLAFVAHEGLGEWKQAQVIADRLIDARPFDSDYWSWRGEPNLKLGRPKAAAIDYRQSMARRPNTGAAPRLRRMDPCEGGFAYLHLARRWPKIAWAAKDGRRLLATSKCQVFVGKGHASVRFSGSRDLPHVDVTVGSETVRMVVDWRNGTTVLSRGLVDRLALKMGSVEVQALAMETLVRGTSVTLPAIAIGGAHTANLDAVVVETLDPALGPALPPAAGSKAPPRPQGILGLDFLWRFDIEIGDEELSLVPLEL